MVRTLLGPSTSTFLSNPVYLDGEPGCISRPLESKFENLPLLIGNSSFPTPPLSFPPCNVTEEKPLQQLFHD